MPPAPPQNAHGSIGEFGLDLTGDKPGYASQWRVVNPGVGDPNLVHTHDFMSYGFDYWVSPLTYDREFESNP
jgi:hypothetical protein